MTHHFLLNIISCYELITHNIDGHFVRCLFFYTSLILRGVILASFYSLNVEMDTKQ